MRVYGRLEWAELPDATAGDVQPAELPRLSALRGWAHLRGQLQRPWHLSGGGRAMRVHGRLEWAELPDTAAGDVQPAELPGVSALRNWAQLRGQLQRPRHLPGGRESLRLHGRLERAELSDAAAGDVQPPDLPPLRKMRHRCRLRRRLQRPRRLWSRGLPVHLHRRVARPQVPDPAGRKPGARRSGLSLQRFASSETFFAASSRSSAVTRWSFRVVGSPRLPRAPRER
jgi:hypothetical protein